MSLIPTSTDILIAGGGPAGLAAAIAARRQGFQVVVADRSDHPIDKVCGEGLMPEALDALRSLGVVLAAADVQPFRGIRFSGHGRSVEALFPHGSGCGVRRTVLHQALAEHALASGARVLRNSPVTISAAGGVEVGGRAVRYRYLVGADGANSFVRNAAGLNRCARDGRRFGFRSHFQVEPWTDLVEVHWGEGCQIYVTPVGPQMVNLALLSRDPELRLTRALTRFPHLARRLAGAPATPERGAVSASRRLDRVCLGRTALVGDASGSVDAVTGYGLSLAFQQAIALAAALAGGDLASYQRDHQRIRRRPAFMADFMLLMDGRDLLRRRVFAALSAQPSVFRDLLAMHAGGLAPHALAVTALSLGWNLLTA